MLDYRRALRSHLRSLAPSPGSLVARYESLDQSSFDVENVLLYNLGMSAFPHLRADGISLERRIVAPPASPERGATTSVHYVRYTQGEPPTAPDWPVVASWDAGDLPTPPSVERLWQALSTRVHRATDATVVASAFVAVDLAVGCPNSEPGQLLSLVKPLVDAAIATLHAYEGDQLSDVSARLATRLAVPVQDVAERLADSTHAVMGPRRLLWPFRDFVQWNPADDLLSHISIRCHNAPSWTLAGSLRADPGKVP
jgi:hypothetical protein